MKSKKSIIAITIIVAFVLIIPLRLARNDGGTIEYSAILYKVIDWHEVKTVLSEETGEYENYVARDDIEFKIFPFNWISND